MTARLAMVAVLVLSLGLTHAAPATAGATMSPPSSSAPPTEAIFAPSAGLYSARYVKSQANCVSLYRWGAGLYGPFDYTIVRSRTLKNGHRRVDLTRWQHPSFIELEHEKTGWRIVAGGW